MDWTAEQFGFGPELRKELFQALEAQDILNKAKKPETEAVKIAKSIAKSRKAKIAELKKAGGKVPGTIGSRKGGKSLDDYDSDGDDDDIIEYDDYGPEFSSDEDGESEGSMDEILDD